MRDLEKTPFDNLLETEQAFYRRVSTHLSGILTRMKMPVFLIEDLVQEAWMSAVQHRDRFTGEQIKRRVCCWLTKVIRGKAVDALRRLSCRPCESLAGDGIDLIDDTQAKRAEVLEWSEWLMVLLTRIRPGNQENLHLLQAHFFQVLRAFEWVIFDLKAVETPCFPE